MRVEAQYTNRRDFDSEALIRLYELMYKYGWMKLYSSPEVKEVESELTALLEAGIEHLTETFEKWLKEHTLPGWWEVRFVETGDDPFLDAISYLESIGAVSSTEVLDWVYSYVDRAELISEELANDPAYFEGEAESFLETIEDPAIADLSSREYMDYIDSHNLEDAFEKWLVDESGVFDKSYMQDIFGTELEQALENPYVAGTVQENLDGLIERLYRRFISHFGLASIIDDIEKSLQYMQSVSVGAGTIPEAIAAFNQGLTTDHYSGTMSEHFAEDMEAWGDISVSLLDALASGEYNKRWDYELKKMGIPIGARKRVVPSQFSA